IHTWMRSKETLEYLTIWESLNNPEFNSEHIDDIMKCAGSNAFTMSPQKWIELTNAKGIIAKKGRGGAIYACPEIALEFAGWISAEFRMYLNRQIMLAIYVCPGRDTNMTSDRFL
ncbi:MAG: KilA-N domain-containing protein, partial [Proteobacteria bacterium]|nr:KilA-N domain-containing protein [Pseudomonadota bacterium]